MSCSVSIVNADKLQPMGCGEALSGAIAKPQAFLFLNKKNCQKAVCYRGADDGNRTRDLRLTKATLYRLSHISIMRFYYINNHFLCQSFGKNISVFLFYIEQIEKVYVFLSDINYMIFIVQSGVACPIVSVAIFKKFRLDQISFL